MNIADDHLIMLALANRAAYPYHFEYPQISVQLPYDVDNSPPAWRLQWSQRRPEGYGAELRGEWLGRVMDGPPVLTDRARALLVEWAQARTILPLREAGS